MWLDNFNRLRKQSGMSLDEICAKSGVPKGTLAKITSGVTKAPALETMRSLVHAMGYTLDDLDDDISKKNALSLSDEALKMARAYSNLDNHGKRIVHAVITEEQRRMEEIHTPAKKDNILSVNWSVQPASAGTGFDLDNENMEQWQVAHNDLTRKADFCLNVQGDSMEPRFHDGDTVLIREQPSVDIGEIGLFIVDGKGYIKQQGPDRLISLNPEYEDVRPDEFSDARCVGKVLGVLEPEWIVEK